MSTDEKALLLEANRINYRLRSTFFYRKLKEYNTLSFPQIIAELLSVEHLYSWDERKQWGIGEDAFNYIITHPELNLLQVFCHPKLLREHPRLLAYYRNIAVLSQKSVSYLVKIDVKKKENDVYNTISLEPDQAIKLSILFNEHVTLIIDSSIQSFTERELHGLLLTSTGAQIDGSWRNAIGEEAEKVVQRLLVNEAKERNVLGAFISRVGTSVEQFNLNKLEEQVSNIHKYRGILLINQTSILFSSEPDISLIAVNGTTVSVIEVKGGADPAGALERYGAAKKSFGEARRLSPDVPTILVASCITPEVHTRISQDALITSYYNLTELLSENSISYDRFMNEVFSLLGIV
ncbi:MAG: XcyI family restriction endonuclease [Nostoc sp. NMS1]|uniref:XcyI family restriction endonuclease n=1 Tax=Nostoc sp. NMS1 TaxID=2815388 RepID=UPI0025FA1CE3|nr:XcyI family restriction endonuclease [Nostoc sp. NMS1]MBN3906729.1 XcyI family restriction endonuclease [Nostoc sp. NMS1]